MKRRDFIVQAVAAGFYTTNFGVEGERLIGSALAAEGNGVVLPTSRGLLAHAVGQ